MSFVLAHFPCNSSNINGRMITENYEQINGMACLTEAHRNQKQMRSETLFIFQWWTRLRITLNTYIRPCMAFLAYVAAGARITKYNEIVMQRDAVYLPLTATNIYCCGCMSSMCWAAIPRVTFKQFFCSGYFAQVCAATAAEFKVQPDLSNAS